MLEARVGLRDYRDDGGHVQMPRAELALDQAPPSDAMASNRSQVSRHSRFSRPQIHHPSVTRSRHAFAKSDPVYPGCVDHARNRPGFPPVNQAATLVAKVPESIDHSGSLPRPDQSILRPALDGRSHKKSKRIHRRKVATLRTSRRRPLPSRTPPKDTETTAEFDLGTLRVQKS